MSSIRASWDVFAEAGRAARWRRLAPMILGGALAFFGPFFLVLWLVPPADSLTATTAASLPPLQPMTRTSIVVAPAAISLAAISDALERAAPKTLSGTRESDGKSIPIAGNIGWAIARGSLAVSGRAEGIQVATPLNGSIQVRGDLQQISGALGARVSSFVGGNLGRQLQGLSGKAIDQKVDLRGNAAVSSRPTILANWRIAPNLDAQASLGDMALPVGGVRLNVANEIKPLLDRSLKEQVGQLEARVRNDPALEMIARREWTKMCRSIPLGGSIAGAPQLWLEIKPTRAAAAQPRVDSSAVHLVLAVEAQTRVVAAETKPACPFPAQIDVVPDLDKGAIKVAVPIDLPFTEISKALEPQLAGRTFPEDGSGPIEVAIKRAALSASGDRLLLSIDVKGREKKSWFSFGASATVHVWGRPVLDQAAQTLRLTDVEIDVDSTEAFGLLGAAADAIKPQLRKVLAEKAVFDLKPFAADAKKRIGAVVADFREQQSGYKVNAVINDLRLVGIEYDAKTLRVITEAEGTVDVAITALSLN